MKTKTLVLVVIALTSLFNPRLSNLRAQGALAPSGAPAPTMRTLAQIYAGLDPRTAISSTNTPRDVSNSFIINQPGSYYLTTNLVGVSNKSGIEITANDVLLDLDGFALLGLSSSMSGIYIPNACNNVTVQNGSINGFGYPGVYSASPSSVNLMLERLNTTANLIGIIVEGSVVVRNCNILNNNDVGLNCGGGIVSGCTAVSNSEDGINVSFCNVSGCASQYNGNDGFVVNCGIVSACYSQSNQDAGIYVTSGTVSGCQVTSNQYSGIFVNGSGSAITGNTCVGNNTINDPVGAGIDVFGGANRLEDNHITGGDHAGIYLFTYPDNIIIKNSVSGNGTNNYYVPSGNVFGPIINQSNGAITNTSPWGNFSF